MPSRTQKPSRAQKVSGWTSASSSESSQKPSRGPNPSPCSPASSTAGLGVFPSSLYTQTLHEGGKAPRPPNAFILFRTDHARLHHNPLTRKARLRGKRPDGSPPITVSRRAADAWARLSDEERAHYARLAEIAKQRHAEMFPGYQYRPERKKARARAASASVVEAAAPKMVRTRTSTRARAATPPVPPAAVSPSPLRPLLPRRCRRVSRRGSPLPDSDSENEDESASASGGSSSSSYAYASPASMPSPVDSDSDLELPASPSIDPSYVQTEPIVWSTAPSARPTPTPTPTPSLPSLAPNPWAHLPPYPYLTPSPSESSLANWNGDAHLQLHAPPAVSYTHAPYAFGASYPWLPPLPTPPAFAFPDPSLQQMHWQAQEETIFAAYTHTSETDFLVG